MAPRLPRPQAEDIESINGSVVGCRVGTDIVAVFSSIDKSWAFTKMFHMLRYPEDIRAYGTLVIGNTGPREQQNKLIKRAAQKTRLGCDGFTAKAVILTCITFAGSSS